jgi:lambda family phage minor tail protein L
MADQKIVQELQGLAPSAIIELFELRLVAALHGSSDVYRFHAGVNGKSDGGNIIWAGQTYSAFPVEATGFEWSGSGQLPKPKLVVANVMGTLTAILLAVNAITPGNDLLGAKVIRRRTLAKYLDAANFTGGNASADSTAEFPEEIYYISRKISETRDVVEFELAATFDLQGVRAPKRRCISNVCQWNYRDATTCGYNRASYFTAEDKTIHTGSGAPDGDLGANGDFYYDLANDLYYGPKAGPWGSGVPKSSVLDVDVCGKTLDSCDLRFGPARVTGTVTQGSTTLGSLSTTELSRIAVGDPIRGHGLPSNATVAGKSSSSLTLSVAATSGTTVTKTGTVLVAVSGVEDGTTMTVSSTTGLVPGMVVSGANIPSGTRISSIDGTTLTLSISENTALRGASVTRTGTFERSYFGYRINLSDTSGIGVGSIVTGEKIRKGTKVESLNAGSYVMINKEPQADDGDQLTATFYTGLVPTSSTYTFTGSTAYTVRPRDLASYPYGSFPGVGGYV